MKPRFKIERGIPLPRPGRSPIYPWYEMKRGDSFFVRRGHAERLRAASGMAAKRLGRKSRFVVRNVEGGVRVWGAS